jgi:hypothetical protein
VTPQKPKKRKASGSQAGRAAVKKLRVDLAKVFKVTPPKATLTEFMRLIQLEKEMDDGEQPTEIEVKWVESEEQSGEI